MKRATILLIAMVIACSMLITSPVVTAQSDESTYEISYYNLWAVQTPDDSMVEKIIEEALNINLIIKRVNHSDVEQINLMFAAGEMPDCGWFNKDIQFMYYDEELSRTIPMDLVREHAPSFVQIYDENPMLWALATSKEDDGQMYCLPSFYDSNIYIYTDFYRYDWLKELGIDLGVEVVQTADRLYMSEGGISKETFREILRGYASLGEGTIPATWSGGPYPQHLSAFGIIGDVMNVDGQAQQYYVTEGYKEYLSFFAELYAEGLIDKEYLTQDRTVWWDKMNKGVGGYFVATADHLASWASGRPPHTVWEGNPEAEILMTPGLADENGNYVQADTVLPLCNGTYFYINANVQDEGKLRRILEFAEYCNFTGDLRTFWYGEENIDWEADPARDGYPKLINILEAGEKGTQFFCLNMQYGDPWNWLYMDNLYESGARFYIESHGGSWMENLVLPYKYDLRGETDIKEVMADVGGRIDTIVAEYRSKAIMGEVDVDATWDQYLADLEQAGYEKLRAEYDKAPEMVALMEEYSQ